MTPRKINRKKPSTLARTARRIASAPRFTRIKGKIKVAPPPDCRASVILKLVEEDNEHRYYAWWLLVGRYDQDVMTLSYEHTGEDTLRCDIPNGTPISAAALLPYMAKFLKSERVMDDKPPVIK